MRSGIGSWTKSWPDAARAPSRPQAANQRASVIVVGDLDGRLLRGQMWPLLGCLDGWSSSESQAAFVNLRQPPSATARLRTFMILFLPNIYFSELECL
jgi:hypothetical protein